MTSRDLAVIVLAILGAIVLLPAAMMWLGGGWGMMGPGVMGPGMMDPNVTGPGMMGRWGFGSGSLFGLLALAVLVAGATVIVLALLKKQPQAEDPGFLLKRRLASGEITKAQFDDLKQALEQ